jgi:glycine/D-amino acid oxidase-like deaminating enzyme
MLSKRGAAVTLVERWQVGGAASGKSGGFLARDWCDGTPLQAMARRSFDLHAQWADELVNPYGYRRVDTFGAALSLAGLPAADTSRLAAWLAPDVAHRQRLGTPETTAQLDPGAFTQTLVTAAAGQSAVLRSGTVSGLERTKSGDRVDGVVLAGGEVISCDAVVLALGPWSLLAAAWLPLPPVYGHKGHSVVFRPASALPPETVFAQVVDAGGVVATPEIVPRTDGTLYVCGLSGTAPLPADPAHVGPEPGGCEKLREIAVRLVPALADAEIVAEQACYRPITADGLPLIGEVAGLEGAYIATGHSVWGMLNASGTGEALADLIQTGKTVHVDLAPFAPSRLAPIDPLAEISGR